MQFIKANNSTAPNRVVVFIALILSVLIFTRAIHAQIPDEKLFSETVGHQFYDIAFEISRSHDKFETAASPETSQQMIDSQFNEALLFLYAATQVDRRTAYVLPDMLSITSSIKLSNAESLTTMSVIPDQLEMIRKLLVSYTNNSSDFFVLRQTVENLLERLDSREEREQFIQVLLASGLQGKNSRFDSYLFTLLGFYSAEKTDLQAAIEYLSQAHNLDNYNHLAFSKLAEILPDQIPPPMYLTQLRLKLVENPLDLSAALDFAQFAESLELYDIAAEGYSYCSDLFAYLYPQENLPSSIYLPWALSYYNTQRNPYKAVQIADRISASGRFDLILQAIAAKASQKISDTQKASQLFQTAEQTAFMQYMDNPNPLMAEQFAWFYSFANIQPMKALDWANKAFSNDPNSISAASLLAYNLADNGQNDLSQTLIENYPPNQILDLTLAKIAIEKANTQAAIEHLNSAIKRDPASLEADLAKQLLTQQGGQYISAIDPDLTLQTVEGMLNITLVPQFLEPENIISASINMRGSKFSYGTALDGQIVITNNSSLPVIVSDNSLFQGNIRVDAAITGDININIQNLVNKRVIPSQPIMPGRNLLIPLRLSTGPLKEILKTHPQASLEIQFTSYIDPVIEPDGALSNNIKQIPPSSVIISRERVNLTRRYLQNRLDSMNTGRQGQKIQTAQLFIGLLEEQIAMARNTQTYKLMYADWMPELLKSAIIKTLSDTDWSVKSYTMAQMLSTPADYDLTNAVAANLNDQNWPVRLIALYLLNKNQGSQFNKVLDWHAEHDSNAIVRDMAVTLAATGSSAAIITFRPTN
jgi:tetratricopeptide (TPR) repeat protein